MTTQDDAKPVAWIEVCQSEREVAFERWQREAQTESLRRTGIPRRNMRALDLFAGCGRASLGLVAAGMRLVGAVERCPRAAASHEALLPGCPVTVADLRELDPATLPDADAWWASPPCQPGSRAGSRKGRDRCLPGLVRPAEVAGERYLECGRCVVQLGGYMLAGAYARHALERWVYPVARGVAASVVLLLVLAMVWAGAVLP